MNFAKKIFFLFLFLTLAAAPTAIFADNSYDISAELRWHNVGDEYPDYNLFVWEKVNHFNKFGGKDPSSFFKPYSVTTYGGPCAIITDAWPQCFSNSPGPPETFDLGLYPQGNRVLGAKDYATYAFQYNGYYAVDSRYGFARVDGHQCPAKTTDYIPPSKYGISSTITITANEDIKVTVLNRDGSVHEGGGTQDVAAGQTINFDDIIPHWFWYLKKCNPIPGGPYITIKIEKAQQDECIRDADCPPAELYCINQPGGPGQVEYHAVKEKYYACENKVCVEHDRNPTAEGCLCPGPGGGCTQACCVGDVGDWIGCPTNCGVSTTEEYCSGDDVKRRVTRNFCEEPELFEDKGDADKWCKYTIDQSTVKTCGCSPVGGPEAYTCCGNQICENFICTSCQPINLTSADCAPSGTRSVPVMDCGPQQTVTVDYCSGGLQCTLTAEYPGTCSQQCGQWSIKPPECRQWLLGRCVDFTDPVAFCSAYVDVPYCNAPSVSISCSGTCAGGSGCNEYDQCVANGTGRGCDNANGCSGSSTRCNAQSQCVEGGGGIACDDAVQCENTPSSCNSQNQCVPGGGGRSCSTDSACANSATKCTSDFKCLLGGTGLACDSDLQCALSSPYGCDYSGGSGGICTQGGGGMPCLTDEDCRSIFTHCNTLDQCVSDGTGALCYDDLDCNENIDHCDSRKKCTSSGTGIACDSDTQCENNDSACDLQKKCTPGGTGPFCKNDNDCKNTHNICNYKKQCVVVSGTGDDQCIDSYDCLASTHNTCNSQSQCVAEDGVGFDSCSSEEDCQNSSHTECTIDKECILLQEPGVDQCENNEDCKNNTHNECDLDKECAVVDEPGEDECSSSDDCVENSHHNECNSSHQCEVVSEPGVDTCQGGADCQNSSHSECSQERCVFVGDPGIDLCDKDKDCQVSVPCPDDTHHTECVGDSCVCVIGSGEDECQNDEQCLSDCPDDTHHTECIGEECICVEGEGADECQSNEECLENQPPEVSGAAAFPGPYCIDVQGVGIAYFQWIYNDEDGDDEVLFELQIDDDSDFSSPEVDRIYGGLDYPAGSINQQVVFIKQRVAYPGGDFVSYNTIYYWRVKVQDRYGLYSDWVEGPAYRRDGHPAPYPVFNFSPSAPKPGDAVSFANSSVCYNNICTIPGTCPDPNDPNNPEKCSMANCNGNDSEGIAECKSYSWDFGDGSYSSAANPSHVYSASKTYYATLQVCDETACCSTGANIPVKLDKNKELPWWKEVAPF